jgi:hypothetical protein
MIPKHLSFSHVRERVQDHEIRYDLLSVEFLEVKHHSNGLPQSNHEAVFLKSAKILSVRPEK